jgi:hypothetical protein
MGKRVVFEADSLKAIRQIYGSIFEGKLAIFLSSLLKFNTITLKLNSKYDGIE